MEWAIGVDVAIAHVGCPRFAGALVDASVTDAACSIESNLGNFTMSYGGIGDRPSGIRTADLEAAQQSGQIKAPRKQA